MLSFCISSGHKNNNPVKYTFQFSLFCIVQHLIFQGRYIKCPCSTIEKEGQQFFEFITYRSTLIRKDIHYLLLENLLKV